MSELPIDLLRRTPPGSRAGDPAPVDDLGIDLDRRHPSSRPIRCRACRSIVTSAEERTDVDGAHLHSRTNPHGATFTFGCFQAAEGAATVGEASHEATWFVGRPWRFALCRQCGAHLGWRWEGERGGFFGLIVERLLEEG